MMDRAAYWLYRLAEAVVGALPLAAGFRIGWVLGALGYCVAGPYRRLVMRNLRIAYGSEKSPAELRRIARRHFATLGANLFASLKLPRLSPEEIQRVVTVEGIDELNREIIGKRGFVVVIGHLGNWELFAQLAPIIFRCKAGTIYQALGNPHIDAAVRRNRERLGLATFERKEGFTAAARLLRECGTVGVLIDQHAGDAGQWCPLFGRLASTTTLPATLAHRGDAWLVPGAIYTEGVARWRCVFSGQIVARDYTPEAITKWLNKVLEKQIRKQPQEWFWVHNRWKTPRPKFLLATYKRGVALPSSSTLQPFRMLLRSPNWLGDAVMSLPAVRAIKRGRPDAHVTILTPARLADVWKQVGEVDQVIAIERGDSVFTVARKLRPHDFEAAILFPNSLRTALEVWLAHIPRRVGLAGHRRAWLLNQIWRERKRKNGERPQPAPHQARQFLRLAEFVGAEADLVSDQLSVNGASEARSAITHHRSSPRYALCPGAEYGPAKRWLPERFAQVMSAVPAEWILVGVKGDAPVGEEILRHYTGPVRNLIGQTTLAQLIDELRACELLLTNDTGTMHLAASLGVRTVAIFGSTEPALTGPLGDGHRVLRHHVPCSPCYLRECPLDFRCMNAVTVEEVVAAVRGSRLEVGPAE